MGAIAMLICITMMTVASAEQINEAAQPAVAAAAAQPASAAAAASALHVPLSLAAVTASSSSSPRSRNRAHLRPRRPSPILADTPAVAPSTDASTTPNPGTDTIPLPSTPDGACRSCCEGGSCYYRVPSTGPEQLTMLKGVQCCGKLNNQPRCCPQYLPSHGQYAQCAVDAGGYVCRDVRSQLRMLGDAAYLSRAGLAVIIVVGSLIVCCYLILGSRRSHATYYGQPAYYGGGGGGGGAGLCAACLAGFCCTELCCTGNINF